MKLMKYFLFLIFAYSLVLSLLFLGLNVAVSLFFLMKNGVFIFGVKDFFENVLLGCSFGVFISFIILLAQFIQNRKNNIR